MKKKRSNVIKIVIVSLLVIVIAAGSWGAYQYKQALDTRRVFEEQQQRRQEEIQQALQEQEDARDGVTTIYQEDRLNFLVMGFDKMEYRLDRWRLFRPDVLVLVSLNLEDDTIDMISFPRDALVWIAHRPGKDKINASFYYGHDLGGGKTEEEQELIGYQYVVDTVSEFLGNIYIDNYITMDMDGFIRLVDDLGGVEIDMPEQDYDPEADSIDARLYGKVGLQRLDGLELLSYVRYRGHEATRDAERAERTAQVVQAVYQEVREENLLTLIPDLIDNYRENIYTDMSLKEMSALALYAQKINLDAANKYVVAGEYEYRDNNIYYIPDEDARIELVKTVFGFDFTPER